MTREDLEEQLIFVREKMDSVESYGDSYGWGDELISAYSALQEKEETLSNILDNFESYKDELDIEENEQDEQEQFEFDVEAFEDELGDDMPY